MKTPSPIRHCPSTCRRGSSVDPQEEERDEREIQEEPVGVLEDERERRLHPVALVDRRLADRAAGRIGEIEAVVGLAVVVAGRPEAERDPQDEDARAEPGRQPVGSDQRGEERRQVAVGLVRRPEQRRQQDAADEQVGRADREQRALDARGDPPAVDPLRDPEPDRRRAGRLARDAQAGGEVGHRGAGVAACRAITASAKPAVPVEPPRS